MLAFLRTGFAASALWFVFAGCASDVGDEAAPADTANVADVEPLLSTSATQYVADTSGGEIEVSVVVTVTNTTSDSLFLSTCGRSTPMWGLERLSGTEYVVALSPVCPMIATPPLAVAPGASRTDTLTMRAAIQQPGRPPVSAPVLEVERVAGTYRIVYEIFATGWDATGAPDQATRLPVDARTSNRFELRE